MDNTELDKLEVNINKVIETIYKLQGENQRLKQENYNLFNRIREYERKIEQLKSLSQEDGHLADQLYNYKQKEEKVKQKIQHMLDKLETLQQLSSND